MLQLTGIAKSEILPSISISSKNYSISMSPPSCLNREQLQAGITQTEQAMKEHKPESEIAEISSQLAKVLTLIYERKIMLKRQGQYNEE